MASQCPIENAPHLLGVADWSSLVSMDQHFDFDVSRTHPSYNASFQINQGHSSSVTGSLSPSAVCNERFSQVVKSSDYPEAPQAQIIRTSDLQQKSKLAMERNFKGKKRKVSPTSNFHETDVPSGSDDISTEQDNKQQKNQLNTRANTQKHAARSAQGPSQEGNGVDEDCIHVRAKRGQATNSHSLAERIRRERISERMRLLQDLVPGCNKITGKAVMLDEIINYVQSLQRQVEFLSMKLANVNPEFSPDIDHILKKDALRLRDGGGSLVGYAQGMNSFNLSIPALSFQGLTGSGTLCGISSESDMLRTPYLHAPKVAQITCPWGDEIQNETHLGYIANDPFTGTKQHGSAKM